MTTSTHETLIPRTILFGNPVKAQPKISPDGKRLAYVAPVDDVLNVWVGTIGGDDFQPVTRDTDRGIRFYFWAADNTHILYLQDVGGNENWRLYATHIENQETRDLTPFEGVQVQVLDHDKHFPNELLIAMNKNNPQVHDVYHLDIPSGTITEVAQNPGNVAQWVTDTNFKVRGAMAASANGGFDLLIRDDEQSEWRPLINWGPDDALTSGPLGFTKDGQDIYVQDSRDVNAGRLTIINATSGAVKVIAEDPLYDVGNVLINPDTYEIQAVAFNKDRTEWTVLDETIRLDFDRIRDIHAGELSISSRDDADETWIVSFVVDNGPISFYVYHRRQQNADLLFVNQPALSDYTLAQMEPITFQARDGLTIHGYLSLPAGGDHTNLPLVLNVHGGPTARDTWGYRPEVQWLTNRGYACLQVNYRGSSGYGKNFINAGNKEWGGKMHTDLIDGVNWVIEQGIADPKRVAIYGGSYGGYAALVGATFTPDVFNCAVDIVGPSNLMTLLRSFPAYWATALEATFYKQIGHPDTDEEFIKSRSPLFFVDNIKIPLLIAQGANDPRVKQAEAEQIVAALKEKGLDYEYMLFPDEGHGFAKPENRFKFYATAEKFLAQHLQGRYEE